MVEVRESPDVEATLDRLWKSGRDSLVTKIEDVKEWIEEGDAQSRPHRLSSPPIGQGWVWVVLVRDRGEEWILTWNKIEEDVAVVYTVIQSEFPRLPGGMALSH